MARIRSTKTARRALVALAVVAMSWTLLAGFARPAHAATFTVTNTNDSGTGSLRQAIDDANNRTGADTINFNIPGAGPHTISPTSELPTIFDPVTINGYSQPGSKPNSLSVGNNAVLKIELNGTNAGEANGLAILASNSAVKGLAINRFGSPQGSRFQAGIFIFDAASTRVEGNFIGTDVTGTQDLGNVFDGVQIFNASSNNIVGGARPAARNVISGNNQDGVAILFAGTTGNKVQGNYIGTDKNGTAALGNSDDGVEIMEASNSTASGNNVVGGTEAGTRNIISGNDVRGINIGGGQTGNEVQGNFIGTDATGKVSLGNSLGGVFINGSSDHTIGGTVSGNRNVISANGLWGVGISFGSRGNRVQGNYIGTDATGTTDLGNVGHGVYIEGSGNFVGATSAGGRNVISGNDFSGVTVSDDAMGNRILSNSIFTNTDLGIDLKGGTETAEGVTANDAGDADTGPNTLQNYPEITSARPTVLRKRIRGSIRRIPTTTIAGTLNSTPGQTFTVQFFSSPTADPSGFGEGKRLVGSSSVTTDSSGDASFGLRVRRSAAPVGSAITATATDSNGNTSEFSGARTVQ